MQNFTGPALASMLLAGAALARDLGDYKNPALATLAAMAVVVVAIWWLAVALDYPRIAEWWPFDWPWWGTVSLPVAARIAFKRLDGTAWVYQAKQQPTEDERLDHMAEYIAHEDAPLLGRRPPATHQELHWVANHAGHIRGGGRNLHMIGNEVPTYEELRIERWRLWAVLKSMKKQAEAL